MGKDVKKQTDMVIKITELMTFYDNNEKSEQNLLELLQRLLDLINMLENVEKTYYLNDLKPAIIIPSRNMPQSNALVEYAEEILSTWLKLKKYNVTLKFIPLREIITNSEKLSNIYFDNINVEKVYITEAAGRSEEADLFIIEKKTDGELLEYDKEYIEKVSMCAKLINESIIAKESHIQNEEILKQILNNIDALIYVSDIETGEVLFVNNAMKKGFGLDDIKGQICWQVFQHGYTGICDFCPIHKLKSVEDEPIIWEEHNTVTNRYYQNTDRLINWVDDRIVHMQYSIDITDSKNHTIELDEKRKELEEAIETIKTVISEKEERTQIMLDATPLCCNFWNEDFQNIDCNEAAVKLFELSSKQDYLDRFFELSPEYQLCGRTSQEMALENITEAFKNGYKRFEWMHQKLNGEQIPSEITLVRVKYGDKYIVLGYTRDLREEKAMLEEIKKKEDNLRLARDIAEENAQAKSEFLSKMSHELRTPLNAIIGMLNIIEKSKDLEKIGNFMHKMKSASNNLLQTINDILDISKIEAGKMELLDNEFNIEEMFRGIFDIIEFAAHEKDITIEMDIKGIIKNRFTGDPKRLGQVYMNLLSNAIKFTPNSGKITILVKYNELENGMVEIISKVKDTGVGIPQDKISRIFQNFSQIDNSLSRQYTGTGLGLVIAKNIVELMNGDISVESEEGVGTTFTFNVILKPCEDQKTVKILPESFHILVIDDSEETCEYLDDLFNLRNIKHKIAKSGEEGIELSKQEKKENEGFNVILVDYMMPTMDGIETVKKLHDVVDPDTVIIMISSIEWNMIEAAAKEVGINKFLAKPLLPSDVINSINEIYSKKTIKHVESEKEIFNFSDKTILLFEDVDINREIIQFLLEDTGAKCIEAEDGKIGVELYTQNPEKYDLILMDIQMPNMDGFEATKLIRESKKPNSKTIPIIAMTANVFTNQIQDTLEAGMNSHLGKPVDEMEMKRELAKYLN